MAIHRRNGGPDTNLYEDHVGSCTMRICYPSISSCISITGVSAGGLMGTHLTCFTPIVEVDQAFQFMRIGGASGCQNFYVIGRFAMFKPNAPAEINSRKKIRNKIRATLNAHAAVHFYDTSAHGEVHVFVERVAAGVEFFRIASAGNFVPGVAYPAFAGRTEIPPGDFVVR